MSFEPVVGVDRLVEVCRHDPWVRWGLPRSAPVRAWHDADADVVAVSRTRRPYGTSLFLLPGTAGLPAPVMRAALALGPPGATGSLTAPAAAADDVLAAFSPAGAGVRWEWRWTTSAPPAAPPGPSLVDLDAADPAVAAELAALLGEHSPRHSTEPGSADVAGWVGVRRGGRIVACAAWLELVPSVPLLASVAVHPDARRQGLAAALTSWISRRALAAGEPAVTVDLYADNDAARQVYQGLGFDLGHEFISWSR